MKAIEVLNRYARGGRHFRRVDLREQSFYGRDLSGADFTGADLRGANFTNAVLREANFTNVLAGVNTQRLLGQLSLMFLVAVVVEFLGLFWNASFFTQLSASQYTSAYADGLLPISHPLLVLICLHIAIAFILILQGSTKQALKSLAVVGTAVIFVAVIAALAGESAIAVAAVVGLIGAVAIAVAAAGAGLLSPSISSARVLIRLLVRWQQ